MIEKEPVRFTLVLHKGDTLQQILDTLKSYVDYDDFNKYQLTGILEISTSGKNYFEEGQVTGVKLFFVKKD